LAQCLDFKGEISGNGHIISQTHKNLPARIMGRQEFCVYLLGGQLINSDELAAGY
jgi:hypothetical protein